MADENNPQTSLSKGSPQGKLPEVDVPSSPAIELNTITQGDLDRLWETCSFPTGGLDEDPWERQNGLVCQGLPATLRDGRGDFSSFWEMTRSSIRSFLARKGKYEFRGPRALQVSSRGGGAAEGDIGGEAEGDIREAVVPAGHASESSCSIGVSRPDVPSREGSIEFVGTIGGGMRIPLHASNLVMSKRIKLNKLTKVAAQKAATPYSKGVVILEGSEMASKKRAPDDGSKGKDIAPPPEAKKIKTGSDAHAAPTRPPVIPEEGSSARRTLGEALGPQASVMASAVMANKILAGVILPADKENVEKLTFDQVVTKFLHVLSQGVILGSSLAVRSRDFAKCALNQRALVESSEMEMVRAQNKAIKLEGALAEEKSKWKKAVEEIETRNVVVAKLEARVAELEKTRPQYPNLGIDLEDVEMDQDFLAQEEIDAEKRATEDEGDGEAGAEGKED
ncbi:hypothetical protein Acr_18g0008670 [Actinidia rufa]|uniref:Uncharacterized protein n=1 Tax=Actinidia rufa TaxID=165716 RepID=A0A7J0G7D9_9ERIC|nr:hypothetical protein Acr_18g0008670 [Actinidia rufa]